LNKILFQKFLDIIERSLWRDYAKHDYIFEENWDVLIILDAGRYDIFAKLHETLLNKIGRLEYRISYGPPTERYIKGNFLRAKVIKHLNNIVYISANPVTDIALGKYKKCFYKYLPVWKFSRTEEFVATFPEDVSYYALKTYLRIPKDKKLIIHFLQPHHPPIGKKYGYLAKHIKADMSRLFRKSLYREANKEPLPNHITRGFNKLYYVFLPMITRGMITDSVYYLNMGKHYTLSDLVRGYIENYVIVLLSVKELLQIFPGRIVVTSDHGEAFGEYAHKMLPLRVYGHPNRIRIEGLVKVPWLVVENTISYEESMRKAIRRIIRYRLMQRNANRVI